VARTIQELAGIRDGVRRQWLLPVPGAGPEAAEIEDTTEETLALLTKQRLISGALARALRSGNPAAIEEARPRRAPPQGTGRLQNLVAGTTLMGGLGQLSFGPIGFPYIIREVVLTAMSIQAAGVEGHAAVTLHLTTTDRTGITAAPAEAAIWPEENAIGQRRETIVVIGADSNTVRYAAGKQVTDTGLFLTAFWGAFPGGSINGSVGILIEELAFGAGGYGALFEVPAGRIQLNPSTRPPAPRLPGPSTPRGAIIRVTQGGRILAERRISWEALDGSIRAKWFNQQVGEPPDPSVEWIR